MGGAERASRGRIQSTRLGSARAGEALRRWRVLNPKEPSLHFRIGSSAATDAATRPLDPPPTAERQARTAHAKGARRHADAETCPGG